MGEFPYHPAILSPCSLRASLCSFKCVKIDDSHLNPMSFLRSGEKGDKGFPLRIADALLCKANEDKMGDLAEYEDIFSQGSHSAGVNDVHKRLGNGLH